jgi:excisionase family DNA binding protein
MDPLLTTEDVAEFFRVDVVTIRRMIGKGELTAYRVGGEYRFKRADIDEYLERQRLPARQERRRPQGKLTLLARKIATGSATEAFARFTKRARTVLEFAQDEAHRLGHNYIGTEHVLLGLLREVEGVAARVLRDQGIELASVRAAVESVTGRGQHEAEGEVSLTPRSKMVLELAVKEADALHHSYIGTEHLLLGLLAEGEGVAARVLKDFGVALGPTRDAVRELLQGIAKEKS